jgi:hypothetical protein
MPAACRGCGCVLNDRRRRCCDACLPEHGEERCAKSARRGPEALAQLRAEGRDPARTPDALAKLSESMRRRKQEQQGWDREHAEALDPEEYRREILPGLRAVRSSS